jgi:hypothetical protein
LIEAHERAVQPNAFAGTLELRARQRETLVHEGDLERGA